MEISVLKKREWQILNVFGWLFNRIAPVIAILTLAIWLIFRISLLDSFLAVVIAFGIAILKQWNFAQIHTLVDFFQRKDMNLWKRVPRVAKVALICVIVVMPFLGIWSFQQNVYVGPTDYMVAMRDGTLLHTRVYWPKGYTGERLPVILSRTPYGVNGLDGYPVSYIDDINYSVVIVTQDLRGCYGSQGTFQIFQTDLTDGVDTVNWIRLNRGQMAELLLSEEVQCAPINIIIKPKERQVDFPPI